MNEEVNFCSQCGATVSSEGKFCSNCGYDLQNSSTQTPLDKTIKVEVTNATVEKGFNAIEKGVKAPPSMINGVWYYLKPFLIVGALLFGIVSALNYAGFFRDIFVVF